MSRAVAVLGGGVAGLSAAHELAERGYAVTVYERNAAWGGKARSVGAAGTGREGRGDLPGEHGFRFFPGFYRHVTDTMARIPYGGSADGVRGALVPVRQMQMARRGRPELHFTMHPPVDRTDWVALASAAVDFTRLGVTGDDAAFFARRLLALLTMCDERREAELERVPWWDFIEAEARSEDFRAIAATGATRTLVAMRAEEGSARTVGAVLVQILQDQVQRCADRVLCGPTNEVWIDPWVAHLRAMGVRFASGSSVRALALDGARVVGARVEGPEGAREVRADHFLCAVPVEVMSRLADPALRRAAPSLAGLHRLRTEWMNGIQFYLRRDVPIARGHSIYLDSPWALTSVSQRQFWRGVDLSRYGDGTVRGILSVDISDWNTPGVVHHKPARRCTREEIRDEVWAQMKEHLNDGGDDVLDDGDVVGWHLDPAIEFEAPDRPVNREPLLINTAGSLADRPEAVTAVGNLFLASDYVRTYTDLATMEAANEAARRAVNGILARDQSAAAPCALWRPEEPAALAPLKALDRERFRRGLAHATLDLRARWPEHFAAAPPAAAVTPGGGACGARS